MTNKPNCSGPRASRTPFCRQLLPQWRISEAMHVMTCRMCRYKSYVHLWPHSLRSGCLQFRWTASTVVTRHQCEYDRICHGSICFYARFENIPMYAWKIQPDNCPVSCRRKLASNPLGRWYIRNLQAILDACQDAPIFTAQKERLNFHVSRHLKVSLQYLRWRHLMQL